MGFVTTLLPAVVPRLRVKAAQYVETMLPQYCMLSAIVLEEQQSIKVIVNHTFCELIFST